MNQKISFNTLYLCAHAQWIWNVFFATLSSNALTASRHAGWHTSHAHSCLDISRFQVFMDLLGPAMIFLVCLHGVLNYKSLLACSKRNDGIGNITSFIFLAITMCGTAYGWSLVHELIQLLKV